MAQEPEDREAMLARMRQERDADNAVTLRASDANRATWLAQVEAALARLRTPTEQAKAYGAALFEQMAAYFRELIGHEPWAYTEMGKVLRVNRPSKTCRVRLGSDDLNPAAVPDERKVSYGFGVPTVGKTYPVHFPTRVTRSGALQAEPDPEHLPWLKAPGGTEHWLYVHQNPFNLGFDPNHPIRRVKWPITVESIVEDVTSLLTFDPVGSGPSNAGHFFVIGYHTGTRRLYAMNAAWTPYIRRSADAPAGFQTWLVSIDDWGFGTQGNVDTARHLWIGAVADSDDPDPAHVHLGAWEPVPEHFAHDAFSELFTDAVPPEGLDVDTGVRARTSSDNGVTWTTQATWEALHPVIEGDSGVDLDLPGVWPEVTSPYPAGGIVDGGQPVAMTQGFTTLADGVFGPAGALVVPVPAVRLVLPAGADSNSSYPPLYDIQLWAYYDGTWAQVAGITPPARAFGVQALWLRQTDASAFVLYARCVVGAPTLHTGPGFALFEAPEQWYRGEGDLTGITWTPIGGVIPTRDPPDPIPPVTVSTPEQLLAVSTDGLALLAWALGEDDDGYHHRIASDDGGDTWAEVPDASGLRGGVNDVAYYDDTILVDIPTDDPRAAPVGG